MGLCSYSQLLLSLLLLLSSSQVRHSAEGRSLSSLQDGPKIGGRGEKMVMVRAMIGSRPPRCERRCISCGHCEAVQVPAVPQQRRTGAGHLSKAITSSWADDNSNYKPLSWKCKCGDIILNP